MTCPYCKSTRVTFPTTARGVAALKTGPATCQDCGAREVRKPAPAVQGSFKRAPTPTTWVPGDRKKE